MKTTSKYQATYRRKHKEKMLALDRKTYWKNRDKNLIKMKEAKKKHPEWNTNKRLKRYKLSIDQYNNMYTDQLGLCALCHEPFGKETPRIDHCHNTKQVRGLLHDKCNLLIGVAKEREDLLLLGAEYISKHKA